MTPNEHAAHLERWLDEPINRKTLSAARASFDALAASLKQTPSLREPLSHVLVNVFIRTGYVKDYKSLAAYCRRVRATELLAEVAPIVRIELPDIWILERLRAGELDAALDRWFEVEEHDRARLCATAIAAAFPDRVDVLVSARLCAARYQIGRSSRSRYRRACRVLGRLRRELDACDEQGMWTLVVEDVMAQHGHRPALVDELEKAGILG